ncbi:hypothetical protein AAG570_009304 [Ranatra chinensis]|uniref:C2H2-type domain-containing protein n=1 Tax=Ranatra chinensis TaxID=642074 RepID=A0ABD0Z5R9_9HEMI
MASKHRNIFYQNKKQERTGIGTHNLSSFCDYMSCRPSVIGLLNSMQASDFFIPLSNTPCSVQEFLQFCENLRTLVWGIGSVYPLAHLQVAHLGSSVVTLVAQKQFFPTVSPLASFQVAHLGSCIVTMTAHKSFFDCMHLGITSDESVMNLDVYQMGWLITHAIFLLAKMSGPIRLAAKLAHISAVCTPVSVWYRSTINGCVRIKVGKIMDTISEFKSEETGVEIKEEHLDINEIYGDLSLPEEYSAYGTNSRNSSDGIDKSEISSNAINGEHTGRNLSANEDHMSSDELPCSYQADKLSDEEECLGEKGQCQVGDTKMHAVGETFVCDHCNYTATQLSHLKRHKKTHGGKLLQCDQCDYMTNLTTNLKRHMMKHTGEKPFICDQCDYRATQLSHLKKHKRTHDSKSFQCDQCNYKTNQITNFENHKIRHSGEKPFQCDQCDYRATHPSGLKAHKMSHSGEKHLQCDQCDYRTVWMIDLKRHKMKHSGEKPYLCDQCDYRATQLSNLKTHKMSHSGDRQFLCDQCDYRAAHLSTLKVHKRTHSNERPYQCDQCDYRAAQLCQLKRHKMRHSKQRPFQCDMCDYGATQLSNLMRHKMRHNNAKSFTCNQCDYRATARSHLKKHMRCHSSKRPHL